MYDMWGFGVRKMSVSTDVAGFQRVWSAVLRNGHGFQMAIRTT